MVALPLLGMTVEEKNVICIYFNELFILNTYVLHTHTYTHAHTHTSIYLKHTCILLRNIF